MTPKDRARLDRLRAERRARIHSLRLRPGCDHYRVGELIRPETEPDIPRIDRAIETVRVTSVL